MATDNPRLTLHEAVSKKFDKTADGTIFTKDIKTIFSLMIICLGLEEQKHKSSKISMLTSKQFAFAFSIQDALKTMGDLSLNVESASTSTTVSYNIKPELASQLLKTFMTARLVHTPADRTRWEPKEKVLLQPTPKGVAVVQSYCKLNGVKYQSTVPIINTKFNSMDLFLFERSPITGTIIYSEYFIHLLFARFLGPGPNVWSSTNPPDEIPSLEHRLQMDDEFDFSFMMPVTSKKDEASQDPKKNILHNLTKSKNSKTRESPFHHNFFTNPESDSHIQYYVSSKGVRLYHNYAFGDIKIKYSFNSKAAWQWLMDCTDIMFPKEASNIINMFYRYGLIEPIILPPSTATSKRNFSPKKTSFYTLSKKGWEISHWGGAKKQLHVVDGEEIAITDTRGIALNNQAVFQDAKSSSDYDDESTSLEGSETQLDIKQVLSDPGLRYLFRLHLEKEFCSENLDVYMDIRYFSKKMTILLSLLEMIKSPHADSADETKTSSSKRAIVKLINECLSSAYNIYSSYITIGAPYQLNLDHMLREKVTQTMLHTTSPLKSHFEEKSDGIDDITDDNIPIIRVPEQAYTPLKHTELGIDNEQGFSGALDAIPLRSPRLKNNKHLSIEIPNEKSESYTKPTTPTTEEMGRSLQLLEKLSPLLRLVGQQILKMLEFDSFPKFLKSETLHDALL